ncbi:MAG: hypothetical protein ABR550_10495, partial [Wenzhouxiangellaceae bacterium]
HKNWPDTVQKISWIGDVAPGKKFGVDHFPVLSSEIVKHSRFSRFGRLQREWTFFASVARHHDEVIICPEIVRVHEYHETGLTKQINSNRITIYGALNALHRAAVYYYLRPLSVQYFVSLIKQLIVFPLKVLLALIQPNLKSGKNHDQAS